MKNYLLMGRIIKPQGVKGEVKVLPITDDPDQFLDLACVYLSEDGGTCIGIESARTREGFAYLMLQGVTDRDQAQLLRETDLYIDRLSAQPLPEGRYYIADLLGMQVQDEAGNELGKLTDIAQAGGNDVYEVTGPRTLRFPALKSVLSKVDVEASVMVLDSQILAQIAVYDDEN